MNKTVTARCHFLASARDPVIHASRFGLGAVFEWSWTILQWPLVFVLVATAIGLICSRAAICISCFENECLYARHLQYGATELDNVNAVGWPCKLLTIRTSSAVSSAA